MRTPDRSPGQGPERIDPFEDRLDSLFEELAYSIRSDRPSILLAPYASEFIRAEVESVLRRRLAEIGQQLLPFPVEPGQFDLPLLLSRHPDRRRAVFSIQGLSRGGGKASANAYKALNIRRELLVDFRLRTVFWLTGPESRQLSRHAPDFWAFRHRVVEFNRPKDINRLGDAGAEPPLQALRSARRAARFAPAEASAWIRLGDLDLRLGLSAEARRSFQRALALAPSRFAAWLGLADACQLGKQTADAIINYEKAIRLDPASIQARLSLTACGRLAGQEALARDQIEVLRPLMKAQPEYDQAVFAGLCGRAPQAVELLSRALEKSQVSLNQVRRDPNLDFIRSDPSFLRLINSGGSIQ